MSNPIKLWVADAREALAKRANDTDISVFESMVNNARAQTQRDISGRPKQKKKDAYASQAIVAEQALILSWRLGWTRSFWMAVADAAARGE